MKNPLVRKLVMAGVVAAIYVVMCMMLSGISFGIINVRFAVGFMFAALFGWESKLGITWWKEYDQVIKQERSKGL